MFLVVKLPLFIYIVSVASLAQLVEQLPLKQTVVGSNPTRGTKTIGLCADFFVRVGFEPEGGVGRTGCPPVEEIIQNRGF